MSVTCGFYNSLNHDRKYDATQMSSIFDGIIKDGVFMSIGTHLTVTAGEGMFVTVGEGKAWFNHTWTLNDAELPLAVEVAELVLDRIDAVVLEVDSSEAVRDNSIKIIKGTPSSEPVNPVMENTETLHQYPLAYIYVKANATEITTSDITNVIGTESTPFITGILETVNIDSLIAQWKSQWNDQIDANQREYDAWLLAQQTSFVTWREEEESTFEAWFENLRNQLDENQATNLQNQIDGIKDELKNTGGSRVVVTIDDKKETYNVVGLFVSLTIDGIAYSSLVGENKIAIFSGIVETGIAEIECYDSMQDFSASVTLEIPYYGHYEVTTKKVDMYEQWLLTAGYTLDDYPEVSDIVNDYEAMYRMMNLHASVDYWVKWYNANNTILSHFTTSEVAMRAIGENDYAADALMVIPAVLEGLLGSLYWEQVLNAKVPLMTSDKTPYGEVYASSALSVNPPYLAFNGNDDDFWAGNSFETLSWLKYVFDKPICVRKISILPNIAVSEGGIECTSFDLYGANRDDTTDGVKLAHIEITQADTPTVVTFENTNYYKTYLLYDIKTNTKYRVIKSVQMYGRQLNALIPPMTSNTTPVGEVSASSVYNDIYVPWKAFDNDFSENSAWHSNDKVNGEWLQIKLPSAKIVKRISLTNRNKDTVLPIKNFKLQGSNDGSYWNDLGTYINEKEGKNETSVFDVNNNDSYLYYRVYIMSSYGAIAVSIGELQLYGPSYEETVSPVVQGSFEDWLEAGGYTIEQYPTIVDVLADEKAVRKLMTVHVSCDAFVNWYNKDISMLADFTANRVAMKWIGLRDYIADKLMSIPSALEQLLASEHWEYILKDKVPKMTSDTAPEGVCNASSVNSTDHAYKAFDRNDNSYWYSASNAATTWLKYAFNSPICARKISIFPTNYNGYNECVSFELYGSNDDDISKWVKLAYIEVTQVNTPTVVVFENTNYYKQYVLYDIKSNTTHRGIKSVQLYGRSLNESVPVMTSDTAPLGECFSSDVFSTHYTYKAFNGTTTDELDCWHTGANATPAHIGYRFTKQIKVSLLKLTTRNTSEPSPPETFVLQGSNDGSVWEQVGEPLTSKNEQHKEQVFNVENCKSYKQYRIYITKAHNERGYITLAQLQFYGVSYSEEEFGSDGIEMLYDNGVEVVEIGTFQKSTAKVTKHDDYVTNVPTSNAASAGGIQVEVNFDSKYKKLIGNYDEKLGLSVGIGCGIDGTGSSNVNICTNNVTVNETTTRGTVVLDVSSVSGNETVTFYPYISTTDFANKETAKLRKFYLIK